MQKKKVITEEHKRRFRKLGSQKGIDDPEIVFGFYLPYMMEYTFYGIAFDSETNIIYGYDTIQGYIEYTIEELEKIGYAGEIFERLDFSKGTRLSDQESSFIGSWDDVKSDDESDFEDNPDNMPNEDLSRNIKLIAKKLFD